VFLLAVAVVCVLAGAKGFREIGDQATDLPQEVLARLGGTPRPLLRRIAAPSEKRIRTLTQALDAAALDEIIGGWLRALADTGRLEPLLTAIAIDGKWLRGVGDGQVKLFAAMLHEKKVMIAQHRIPDETTEVKELLGPVDLDNAVVTADAAHAQRETAAYIAGPENDGGRASDYFLFVKGNQPGLQRAIFGKIQAAGKDVPHHVELDYGHGRIIRRSLWVTDAGDLDFPHASRVARIRRDRYDITGAWSARRSSTPSPASTRNRPAPRTSPPSPAASGESSPCTGCATPPGLKTLIPDMPGTARRSWPPSGTSPSACSTTPASPRSPAPCKPSSATGTAYSTTCRYEIGITNDFADPVVSIEDIPIGACVFLDAEGREITAAYEPLAYPDRWRSVGYARFGSRLRAAYDEGDTVVRAGTTPACSAYMPGHKVLTSGRGWRGTDGFDPALLGPRRCAPHGRETAIVRHVPGEAQTSGNAAPGREVSGW
jgi:DDE_Tnp_1-associated